MNIREEFERLLDLDAFSVLGDDRPTLTIRNSSRPQRRYGFASSGQNRMNVTTWEDQDEDMLREVIIHELAHLASGKKYGAAGRGHGTMWKNLLEDAFKDAYPDAVEHLYGRPKATLGRYAGAFKRTRVMNAASATLSGYIDEPDSLDRAALDRLLADDIELTPAPKPFENILERAFKFAPDQDMDVIHRAEEAMAGGYWGLAEVPGRVNNMLAHDYTMADIRAGLTNNERWVLTGEGTGPRRRLVGNGGTSNVDHYVEEPPNAYDVSQLFTPDGAGNTYDDLVPDYVWSTLQEVRLNANRNAAEPGPSDRVPRFEQMTSHGPTGDRRRLYPIVGTPSDGSGATLTARTGRRRNLGQARGYAARERDHAVIREFGAHGGCRSVTEVATALGITPGQARHAIWRLRGSGDIVPYAGDPAATRATGANRGRWMLSEWGHGRYLLTR